MTNELPLRWGRITKGVVRVGDTVRRPIRPSSPLVRTLLAHLPERGFYAAPRYLGRDERERDVFRFVPGAVPTDLDPAIPDDALAAGARLIRIARTASTPAARSSTRSSPPSPPMSSSSSSTSGRQTRNGGNHRSTG